MIFHNILGQDRVKTILQNAILNNKISHSYLFYGPEGVGKKFTAYEFAKTLNCITQTKEICNSCISCIKIEKNIHPDVHLIEPDGQNIRIGQIRDIQKTIGYKPFEGKNKIIIFDNADKMLTEAANAFLKTLEEPPAETIIILICENPMSIIPTISSRCQQIKFNLLPNSIIEDIIRKKHSLNENDVQMAIIMAHGSLGKALDIQKENDKDKRIGEKSLEILKNCSLDNIGYILNTSKIISSLKRNEIHNILNYLIFFVRDMAVIKSGSPGLVLNKWAKSELIKINTTITLLSIQKIFTSIMYIKNAVSSNANIQLSIEVLMFKIARVLN